jgi:hypothetical protein
MKERGDMLSEVVDVIVAVGTVVAALVAAVSARAAMVSARAATRQVQLMVEEMEKRERPYIYGHFHARYGAVMQFSLENKSGVAAINVRARFEEPAPISFNEISLNSAQLLNNTIEFFGPGERFTVDIDRGMEMFAEGKQTVFKLNLSYQTPGGREIDDSIVFDISYLRSLLDPPPTTAEALMQHKETLDKLISVMEGRNKRN